MPIDRDFDHADRLLDRDEQVVGVLDAVAEEIDRGYGRSCSDSVTSLISSYEDSTTSAIA